MTLSPPSSTGSNPLRRDSARGGSGLLRVGYILFCIAFLGVAWIWAHDTPPQAVTSDLTPRSAGPLIGQPTPPAPPPTQTAPPARSTASAAPPAHPSATIPDATPWPAAAALTPDPTGHMLILQDRNFAGGLQPQDGLYRDRTARLAMGGAVPISAQAILTAPFNLNLADGPIREATLTLVGLSGPLSPVAQLRITLNDALLYEGPSLFPLDDQAGQASPANWGGASWPVPETAFRQGGNRVVITNLADSARFIAVDYVLVVWKR